MTLFRNVVLIAAAAGLVAGIVLAAMQAYATVPLILKAETYENAGDGHSHDHALAPADENADSHAPAAQAEPHDHGEGWAPADGIERFAFTAMANIASGIGFALVLLAVSELAGGIGNWRQGLFWGFAGFAVFTLAPGLGLPPELPAMPAADLMDRQIWWFATVVATAIGLALIAFRNSAPVAVAGVALIVAPHIIGAPQPANADTPVPADLYRNFVVAVTITSLIFWMILGGVAGALRSRFVGVDAAARGKVA